MAQPRKRNSSAKGARGKKKASPVSWEIPWDSKNLIGIGVGVGVILLGYLLMSSGITDEPMTDKSEWNNTTSTVIAPIVLTIAYCIIIPMAIFYKKKGKVGDEVVTEG